MNPSFEFIYELTPNTNFLLINNPADNQHLAEYLGDDPDGEYALLNDRCSGAAKTSLIALVTRDDEIDLMERLVEQIPSSKQLFGKPISDKDIYHCRIIFINTVIGAYYGIGVGRKARVFDRGPFTYDGAELEGGLSAFTEIDISKSISSITELLIAAGEVINESANSVLEDDDEIDSMDERICEAIADLNLFLELDYDDIENYNH
jgi:hypothetical protein